MNTTHGRDEAGPDIFAAVAMGDQSAFERVYRLYANRVYHYVLTLVGDPTVAEDIVGETMIAVWRGAATFAGGSRPSTWIFGIARHKALDTLRRSGRRQREVGLDNAVDVPVQEETAFDSVHRKQMEAVTKRALAILSPEHQEVLRLVFYEELPYEEIARLLSIPHNTVKTRVFYAKQQLKRQLERLAQKEPIP